MSDHLLTDRYGITDIRRKINGLRGDIGYDIINSPYSDLFEELEVLLHDAVVKCDEIHDKLKEHVYAYDVTVTNTLRVYVKGTDEDRAQETAIDYALRDLSPSIDWHEDDILAERLEHEETTTVYDVEA